MGIFFRHILFILIAGLLVAAPVESYAQKTKTSVAKTKTSVQKKASPKKKSLSRAEYEKQQKDLQQKIKATEKMISDNDKSVMTQSRDIKLREQEIGQRRALLVAMHKEIDAIAYEEDSLKIVISDLQKSYEAKKQKYGLAMRHMYRNRSGYEELLFVLSSNSMIESIRRMRYLRQYSDWRKQEALALEEQRVATVEAKEDLARMREDREEVLGEIDKEREALTRKQAQQEMALMNLKKRGQELQAELEKDQKQQAEVERKIQQMIEEERRKAEEARRKAEAEEARKAAKVTPKKSSSTIAGNSTSNNNNKTNSSSTNTQRPTTSAVSSSSLTGSFRANKGKLPYPVDSNYAFLRHYKEKNDGNVSITLSTATGANACAVFEGTVLRCSRSSDDFTVIISHGDYMSVYSNLSSVTVKEGQKVKMRQTIGKVKSDVDGKRGELMFWIYGKSEAENPETWLRR